MCDLQANRPSTVPVICSSRMYQLFALSRTVLGSGSEYQRFAVVEKGLGVSLPILTINSPVYELKGGACERLRYRQAPRLRG